MIQPQEYVINWCCFFIRNPQNVLHYGIVQVVNTITACAAGGIVGERQINQRAKRAETAPLANITASTQSICLRCMWILVRDKYYQNFKKEMLCSILSCRCISEYNKFYEGKYSDTQEQGRNSYHSMEATIFLRIRRRQKSKLCIVSLYHRERS